MSPTEEDQNTEHEGTPSFLPDFCNTRIIFLMVMIAELLAIIFSLASGFSGDALWVRFALVSLFIQWVALGNVFVLCLARRWLERLEPVASALSTYGLSLIVTLVVSLLATFFVPESSVSLSGSNTPSLSFVLRNMIISAIVSAVALRYFYVRDQWKHNIEAEAKSRIQALQARIRPHFLFNSMNTIASLTRTNPELAEKAVEDLADLFRASLGHRNQIRLEEELDFTRRYINIEQLRLGERLSIHWDIQADLDQDAKVPALMLQPLVENAIYHGIEPQTRGGEVSLAVSKDKEGLLINVSNPTPPPSIYRRRTGNRMAQDNIRQRLKLAYGGDAKMNIQQNADVYTVSVIIPENKPS